MMMAAPTPKIIMIASVTGRIFWDKFDVTFTVWVDTNVSYV